MHLPVTGERGFGEAPRRISRETVPETVRAGELLLQLVSAPRPFVARR